MWIEPIYDRTQEDITEKTSKGYLNIEDLNRIESNTEHLGNAIGVDVSTIEWTRNMFPTKEQFDRILNNLEIIKDEARVTYDIPTQPINTYSKVNAIEKFLYDVYQSSLSPKIIVPAYGITRIWAVKDSTSIDGIKYGNEWTITLPSTGTWAIHNVCNDVEKTQNIVINDIGIHRPDIVVSTVLDNTYWILKADSYNKEYSNNVGNRVFCDIEYYVQDRHVYRTSRNTDTLCTSIFTKFSRLSIIFSTLYCYFIGGAPKSVKYATDGVNIINNICEFISTRATTSFFQSYNKWLYIENSIGSQINNYHIGETGRAVHIIGNCLEDATYPASVYAREVYDYLNKYGVKYASESAWKTDVEALPFTR